MKTNMNSIISAQTNNASAQFAAQTSATPFLTGGSHENPQAPAAAGNLRASALAVHVKLSDCVDSMLFDSDTCIASFEAEAENGRKVNGTSLPA